MSISALPARSGLRHWQPDWISLNVVAASFTASTPLAARIKTVTPVGGYVAIGLQLELSQILAAAASSAGTLTGVLAVACDTLVIPVGSTLITAPAVDIVARSIQVEGGGSATLTIRGAGTPAVQTTTASITGSVAVSFQAADGSQIGDGASATLTLTGVKTPQVLTVSSDAPGQITSSTTTSVVADALHVPWAIVALEVSSTVASVLIDQQTDESIGLAADMLRWVTGGCYALVAERSSFTTVDYEDVGSLLNGSIGLLAFTQTAASGATYVPVLSDDVYQARINALLGVAAVYDQKLADLANQSQVDQLLASFASTLSSINQSAETPLFNTLQRLNVEAASLQTQLLNATIQLQNVGSTLPDLQTALVDAINEQFQRELVKTALETFFTLVSLYVGAGAVILGDPEILAGKVPQILAAALDITKQLIEAGEKIIGDAIAGGEAAAGSAPSQASSEAAKQGAEYLAGSIASFGEAANALWTVVNIAVQGGQGKINFTPGVLAAVEQLPDLSGFSVGGLDPVTYWSTVVVQTRASIEPHKDLPQATAYLEAVELAATYGKGVGDLQMKLLDLYTQAMGTFDQLRAVYEAEAKWNELGKTIQTKEAQIAAAQGLLQRGYLGIKRNLVLAVENYRAAFQYQWLQPSSISIDVSMDYLALKQQALASITSLEQVLAGTNDGTVRPRQRFQHVTYLVQREAGPLFTVVNGRPQAQWSISTDDPALAKQLSGNTALFLTAATFELEGAEQTGEVELQVATSGHYDNKLGATAYRFVSVPVSMTSNYLPGSPPDFITSWQFADAASYIAPSPYSNWTMTVMDGDWQGVTAIKMTVAGIMLQNP